MVHEQDFLTACIDQKWCGLYTSSLGDFSDHLLRLDTAEFVHLRRFLSLNSGAFIPFRNFDLYH